MAALIHYVCMLLRIKQPCKLQLKFDILMLKSGDVENSDTMQFICESE